MGSRPSVPCPPCVGRVLYLPQDMPVHPDTLREFLESLPAEQKPDIVFATRPNYMLRSRRDSKVYMLARYGPSDAYGFMTDILDFDDMFYNRMLAAYPMPEYIRAALGANLDRIERERRARVAQGAFGEYRRRRYGYGDHHVYRYGGY
jgi:hypothetical protein